MTAQEFKIVDNMAEYGGSFVRALAEAFYKADNINFKKLKDAFPDYWEHYKKYNNKTI